MRNFVGGGSSLAAVDSDLSRQQNLMPRADAYVMARSTAVALSLLRGTGGALAHPDIRPDGGSLLGLPVYVTQACEIVGSPTRNLIGLISSPDIFALDTPQVELTHPSPRV